MLKNIIKNFSALILSQLLYKLLSFFAVAYVARQAGDAKFGQLSFALYLGLLFFALADMGLSEVYICEAAGNSVAERKLMGISIGNRIILLLPALLLLIICAFLLIPELNSAILILLVGVSMIIDSFTFFLRSVFRVRERMGYEAISFTLEGFIKCALLILTVIIFRADLLFIGIAFLITSIITCLITTLICKNKFFLARPIFDRSLFLQSFKRGLPFVIIGFLSIVSLKIDIIMLSKMSSDSITGLYSAAVKLIESILVIPVTLSIVLFPVAARFYKNLKRSFFSMYKLSSATCLVIGMFITFLLYISADFFISFIFGGGFFKSVYIVRILSFVIIPFFLKLFLERAALVLGKFNVLLEAYIGGVILKIILNLLFIPVINYRGAAFATIFTEVLIVLFIFLSLRKYFARSIIKMPPEDITVENAWVLLHEKE